ncbi:MAG: hypothetical protein ACI4W6_07800 [Acutalibacteraceae bacterium]
MTIREAIDIFDSRFQNEVCEEAKINWLSILDSDIKKNVIDTHEGAEQIAFSPYSIGTDYNTKLLIDEPYSEIYIQWMLCQLYLNRAETALYNNAVDLYNQSYYDFRAYYNRTHMPIGCKIKNYKV